MDAVYDHRAIEERVQALWKKERVPERVTAFDHTRKKFFLLDGPPYVNYIPHVGHVKTTTFKDLWGRFKQMQGFSVWWQPGFDCSGLPIENAVEKMLGVGSKQDIEKLGVGKFIGECRKLAEKNRPVWMELYRKLGAWRGWVEPYLTYKNEYVESGWWTFKQMFERGLLVEGFKSGFWCSRCETVLAGYEVTDSHRNVQDPSIIVKFPVKGEEGTFLLVWTTTPWTLPGNVCIAAHPEEVYVRVRVGEEHYILAEKRLELLDGIELSHVVEGKYTGRQLDGMEYQGVTDTPQQREMDGKFHSVILSIKILKRRAASKTGEGQDLFEDFVTMDSGTGLVHTAPGAGDSRMGEHYNLPFLCPVDEQGRFTAEAGPYKGMKVKEADAVIIRDLRAAGLLLSEEKITHPYPLCWRCKTPLIYRMSSQWFLKIDPLRERMMENAGKVAWLPPFAQGRFEEILSTAPDWAVTRQRYWGIPLPVWVCGSCGQKRVVGSAQELRENAEKVPEQLDLHKDVVDGILLKCGCGSPMRRLKDVMDVWFDSGIAPWASLGYPFRNKDLFEKLWPVDLIDESQDQTRGWFYTLMVCGEAVWGVAPYRTVCLNGWTLDAKGEKMSKSVGNVVWAEDAYKALGADALRLSYCTDVAPWDIQKFSPSGSVEVERSLGVLWNIFQFVKTYGSHPGWAKEGKLRPEDRWIISRANTLVGSVTSSLETFHFHSAGRELLGFILNDLSRWYVKLIRERVAPFRSGLDKEAAQFALSYALERAVRLLAPFAPFISEAVYQELFRSRESVHLEHWPLQEKKRMDSGLEQGMEAAKKLVEGMNALRQERKIKLKWPVDKAFVHSGQEALKELEGVIREMGNVKEVAFVDKAPAGAREWEGGTVALGKVLEEEALVRELIRAVQELRKKARLQVGDRISLFLRADQPTEATLRKFEQQVREGTGASDLEFDPGGGHKGKLEFEGKAIAFGFEVSARADKTP